MTEERRRARLDADTLDADDTIYIVPVSGGKDSQMVLALATDRYPRDRIKVLHNYTGIDHSLTYEHLQWMSEHYGVLIENTRNPKYKDMWELLDKRNGIPGRMARFCTDELKIQALNHWLDQYDEATRARMVVLFGMRGAESQQREAKYGELTPHDEFSLRDLNRKKVWKRLDMVRVRLPIVNVTTPAVFQFFRDRNERINPLYARGHHRVGCYPCILAGKRDYRLAARDPEGRQTIIKLRDFKEMVETAKGFDRDFLIEHDLYELLENEEDDRFGFYQDLPDDDGGGCSFCAE